MALTFIIKMITRLRIPIESQIWWYMPVIPALGKWRQEDCKLENWAI
jgi:hypothetical protein